MPKEEKKASLSDYSEENLLASQNEDLDQDLEEQDQEEQEEDEIEEKPKKKVTPKKKVVVDEEEESEDEEDLEEEKPKPKKKIVKKVEPKETEEETEEEADNDLADATEESDDDAGDEAQEFFEQVEKITGTSIDVDYGDANPLSPQGVAIREKAVREAALDDFLNEIEQKFPAAFRALQHSYNGGDIAELFTQTSGRDYTTVDLKEGDDAAAKEILKEYYKSRGVKNEARITKMIEADEDSEGGLIAEAKTALEELKAEQLEKTNQVLETQKQKATDEKKKDSILFTSLDEVLEARQLGSFKIADRAEASEFKKYVTQNLRKTKDGKYELATPLDPANIEKALQFQFFQFKKGDLTKIIQQRAATENARKISLKLKGEQQQPKKNTKQEDKRGQSLSLKSYEV